MIGKWSLSGESAFAQNWLTNIPQPPKQATRVLRLHASHGGVTLLSDKITTVEDAKAYDAKARRTGIIGYQIVTIKEGDNL